MPAPSASGRDAWGFLFQHGASEGRTIDGGAGFGWRLFFEVLDGRSSCRW